MPVKTIEKCDAFQGIQLIHSVAGGTGSGCSAVFLEQMKIDFPTKPIFAATVHANVEAGTLGNINFIAFVFLSFYNYSKTCPIIFPSNQRLFLSGNFYKDSQVFTLKITIFK